MKNLIESVSQIVETSEQGYVDALKNAGKFPGKGKKAAMKDPVHVQGMGVMEREQAKRLFPDAKHTETKLYKEETKLDESSHVFNVTYSDPNHTMVSKRNEKSFRQVTYNTTKPFDKSYASEFVRKNVRKQGFTVHDVEHVRSSSLSESNEGKDTITMTIPLFIRCLEWAKETAKDDVEIHKFVELAIAKSGTLDTDDYDSLIPSGSVTEAFRAKRKIESGAANWHNKDPKAAKKSRDKLDDEKQAAWRKEDKKNRAAARMAELDAMPDLTPEQQKKADSQLASLLKNRNKYKDVMGS